MTNALCGLIDASKQQDAHGKKQIGGCNEQTLLRLCRIYRDNGSSFVTIIDFPNNRYNK